MYIEESQINKIPSIGTKAPDLELEIFHDKQIKKTRLSEYHGRWLILFFYPADFTFVCPTELEDMADHYPQFQANNAEVISISTDTAFVHKAWQDQSPAIQKIRFPMAADPSGKISRAFGAYIAEQGLARRATFLLNAEGIVKAFEFHDDGIGRNAGELLRKLQAAAYVETHGGEVCPARWKPGDKTLSPGLDLVGKI